MSPQEQHDAISGLKDHPGWLLISEAIRSDMDAKIRQMCQSPEITEARLNYLRGAIFAAQALLNAPETAITNLATSERMAAEMAANRE